MRSFAQTTAVMLLSLAAANLAYVMRGGDMAAPQLAATAAGFAAGALLAWVALRAPRGRPP